MDRLLFRPEEAAELLGIGRTTVYQAMRCGQLDSVRIGTARRIPAAAMAQFVEMLRAEATAETTAARPGHRP